MKYTGLLALLPLIGMFLGPICHNASKPFILGMPFILGWIVVWIIITSAVMALVYWLDPVRGEAEREDTR
jgi:hypothetical protein